MNAFGGHPSSAGPSHVRFYGRRIMLRPLVPPDFTAWSDVRRRNEDWLLRWEPTRPVGTLDPVRYRDAFVSRCNARDKERQYGQAYCYGLFIDGTIAGELNVNNVQRGAAQSATLGYWIDQRHAGGGYVPEAVVLVLRHCFDDLRLHRVEICIVPRNRNSRRVMDKLIIREEGVALRFLEIAGAWEDHVRYAITAEEWTDRQLDLVGRWLV